MSASAVQPLFAEAKCFLCYGASSSQLMRLALFSRVATKFGVMTDTQTLLAEGKCFACFGASTAQILQLALMARIVRAFDANAEVTPEALIAYAKCFNCFTDASLIAMMEMSLLDKMANLIT